MLNTAFTKVVNAFLCGRDHLHDLFFWFPRLFADDTCLILQDKHLSDLKTKINNELNAINKWIIAYKLSLNLSKSNIIIVNSTCDKKKKKNGISPTI